MLRAIADIDETYIGALMNKLKGREVAADPQSTTPSDQASTSTLRARYSIANRTLSLPSPPKGQRWTEGAINTWAQVENPIVKSTIRGDALRSLVMWQPFIWAAGCVVAWSTRLKLKSLA